MISDYGAFRDLQRHRLLTIQWQELTPALGYEVPDRPSSRPVSTRAWREAVREAESAYKEIAPPSRSRPATSSRSGTASGT